MSNVNKHWMIILYKVLFMSKSSFGYEGGKSSLLPNTGGFILNYLWSANHMEGIWWHLPSLFGRCIYTSHRWLGLRFRISLGFPIGNYHLLFMGWSIEGYFIWCHSLLNVALNPLRHKLCKKVFVWRNSHLPEEIQLFSWLYIIGTSLKEYQWVFPSCKRL